MTEREKVAAAIRDDLRRLDQIEEIARQIWDDWAKGGPKAPTMRRLRKWLGIPDD